MSQLHFSDHTPRLFSTAGTFGEVDIVAGDHSILIDLTGLNYDTAGFLRLSNVLASLTISEAHRLAGLLQEAIAFAENADPRQSELWSNIIFADSSLRFGRSAVV